MRPVHYMIQVRDLPAAIWFYQQALGFEPVDRHEYEGATLVYMRGAASSFELELLAPDTWAFGPGPESGRVHIAFAVDRLEAERERLLGLGFEAGAITDHVANGRHQTRYFYFTDPEGNQIEFLEAQGRYGGQKEEAHA